MATKTWNPGATGSYLNPANWSGNSAPGPGDTALVSGPGSDLAFYDPANNPIKFSPDPAPPGYTIAGQTITLQAQGGTDSNPAIQGIFSNTTLGADTTVNAVGPGITRISAWFDNTLAGTINVGDNPQGYLQFQLWSDWPKNNVPPPNNDRTGLPTTTNAGTINVHGDGGEFWLYPVVGGGGFHVSGDIIMVSNPATGWANFVNAGQINVAPGGTFLDRGSSNPGEGLYFHEFINNGNIQVRGTAGKNTTAVMDANLEGAGSITVDGGTSSNPAETQFALTGPLYNNNVFLRSASMYMKDQLDFVRAAGGTVTFEDSNSYLYLKPSLNVGPVPNDTNPAFQTQSLVDHFGATIKGFRAGDTIAIERGSSFGEVYGTQWDQATHQLTVTSTNSFNGAVTDIAQFTLDGTYDASEFQVWGGIERTGHEIHGAQNDPTEALFGGPLAQIDITTTHQAPPNFTTLDTTTNTPGSDAGQAYAGPVNYLQWQYIWAGADSATVNAAVPNSFINGGPGNDVLTASGGSNILDGGTGTNLLIGALPGTGGTDTFVLDGRQPAPTWDTVSNFHAGDSVTLLGFVPGQSTMTWTANEGADGYKGATLHAAFDGSTVNGSVTFAGVSLADAQSKFSVSSGMTGDLSYLTVRFAG